VRRNAPYRGRDDGLPTALRRRFAPRHYLGVELEVSQALLADPRRARRVAAALAGSLARLRAERRSP
jgi:predicted N-formylglutamate amidohydrolase